MRLKSMKVRKAGPIDELDIRFGDINLIVGNNEEGKTTLTDLLIRSVFGKRTNYNKNIWNERFDLDGKTEFEMVGGIPGEDALKYTSLYVIREGDMRWQGRSSKNEMLSREMWNEDIKEILYGSDEVYSRVSKKAVELMGVAAGKGWMQKFLSNIDELRRTAETELSHVEEYKDNESLLAVERLELAETEKKLDSMTGARKISASMLDRELIERFFKKTDELASVTAEREKLGKMDLRRALESWSALDKDVVRLEKEISRQDAGKTSLEERRKEKIREFAVLKKKTEGFGELLRNKDLERKKKTVDLDNEKKNYERDMEKWTGASYRTAGTVLASLLVFFLSISAVTGVLAILVQTQLLPWDGLMLTILIGFGISLFCATVLMTVRLIRGSFAKKGKQKLEDRRQTVIRDLEYQVRSMDNELERIAVETAELRADLETCERDIANIDNGLSSADLDSLKKELEEKKSAVGQLARIHQSYEHTLQETNKMEHLEVSEKALNRELQDISAKIQARFGAVSASLLKEELKKIRDELSKAGPESQYNEEQFEILSGAKDGLGERIYLKEKENEKIRTETLTLVCEGLNNLTRDVKKDYLDAFYSETASFGLSNDIFNIFAFREKLDAFSAKVREDARLAGEFLKVLETVQSDVRSLIGTVLHTGRFRSALSKLTNGRYQDIEAKDTEGSLEFSLKDDTGFPYPLRTLSTGTRNQVYFAVRLSLAQNLFRKEKGIFILDDAFLTFDEGRRRSALELLADYAKDGWQVIYASVNERNMEGLFDSVFGKGLNKIMLSVGAAS